MENAATCVSVKNYRTEIRKAKVKAWVWQFLGYQEETGCSEGGRAVIAQGRHWETAKPCAELVGWPVFPNDSIQAKVMPFSESLFTLSHSSPLLFFLSHYLTLIFPMCLIFSHNHPHTYLWLGDLVMAFWTLRDSNATFTLSPPPHLYSPKKQWLCPQEKLGLKQKPSPAKPFPLPGLNDD